MDLGIDFDGVISDATLLKQNLAHKLFGVSLKPEECSKKTIKNSGLSEQDYIQIVSLIYNTKLGLQLEEIPGSKENLELLIKKHSIHIISSRNLREAYFAKKWLTMHQIPYTDFIFTSEKPKLQECKNHKLSAFLDDSYENLVPLAHNGLDLYLFSSPTNSHIGFLDFNIARVKDWNDFSNRYNF